MKQYGDRLSGEHARRNSVSAFAAEAFMNNAGKTQFIIGTACALAVATALTMWIPRLYPWVPPTHNKPN